MIHLTDGAALPALGTVAYLAACRKRLKASSCARGARMPCSTTQRSAMGDFSPFSRHRLS